MPRKSPRSRRRRDEPSRVPSAGRPRTRPGRKRAVPPRPARAAHARKGARTQSAAAPPPAGRRPAARRRRTGKAGSRAAAAPPARRGRAAPPDPARVAALLDTLDRTYPDATTALDFASPLQLLVATILSAQCTDERVNKVTPGLFARWPDAAALAAAPAADLERCIHSTGFFRMKARAIREAAADIATRHAGEVPRTMDELTALRGVGRKTANVVLGNAYGIPGLVVDTHVTRVSNRLGLTAEKDAVRIEHDLMKVVPEPRWTRFSHWLILHGRQVCNARKPWCSRCPLAPSCPRIGVTVFQ